MRLFVILTLFLALPDASKADWKTVSAADSRLLLSMPYLESATQRYDDGGWNAQATMHSSYAAAVPKSSVYPRAQVLLDQAAQLTYWKLNIALDADWVKRRFPFFKDREVRITQAAPDTNAFLRIARFSVGEQACFVFDMRHRQDQNVSANDEAHRRAVAGIYCPPPGMAVTDELVHLAVEGIFVRTDVGLQRVMPGIDKPIPAGLTRAGKTAAR
jgi:hypothetical protein